MKKKPAIPSLDAAELRSQAEAKLSERKKKTVAPPATEPDPQRLVHELEVHQIELEMQNEEMLQSRAQVEAGLRQYTDLYDFAPIGYFTLVRDGAIHQVNLAGANLLGVERGALIKRRFGVFVSARSRTTFSVFLDDVFTSGSNETCEVTLQKDGSAPRLVHIEAITKDGQREVCYAVVVDITERKQMEQKLNEAYQKIKTHTKELEMINENLDSFAYSVSHDLRAPLRAISGFAQVLIDTHGDKVNEEMRHYLNRISEGAKKMGQLIDDLLGFSRATRSEIKYEKINVENIVNDLVKAYREVEQDRDIEFIVNPLGEVEADKEMLKVVFSNLLQNAVKFTIDRKKARIEIGSEQKEDHIQFYVKDNGIGFDMRYKDKLFTAFQRLQTDERFTGTGIGLTTVKRIVTKHGGNIWAKGEVDRGAEFCFTLPSKRMLKIDT